MLAFATGRCVQAAHNRSQTRPGCRALYMSGRGFVSSSESQDEEKRRLLTTQAEEAALVRQVQTQRMPAVGKSRRGGNRRPNPIGR